MSAKKDDAKAKSTGPSESAVSQPSETAVVEAGEEAEEKMEEKKPVFKCNQTIKGKPCGSSYSERPILIKHLTRFHGMKSEQAEKQAR